jgi:putative membrane protein
VTGRAADLLTREGQERVARAVAQAEAGTAGEIVVMLGTRAGRYRSVVLTAALVAGLIVPWPLLALTEWSTGLILLAQAGVAALILAASEAEPLRLALVPRRLRRARVREAAQFAFWSRGLSRTRGRTGVLLFLALAERHAEIVADEGILARIAPDAWRDVLRDLMAALARGEAEAGLIRAVERIGAALAAEFPAAPGDTDELPNRVIVAE